jgi:hypothetical protein
LVSSCRKLDTLILGLCPNLTEQSILAITKYSSYLKTFALWENFHALNDQNAETFSRGCGDLEIVTFTMTGISDVVLRKLFQHCCISKIEIEINCCRQLTDNCMQDSNNRLTHFVAENVYFTDIACAALSLCPSTSFGISKVLKNCHK